MRSRHALVIGTLAVAASAALVPTEPTLAVLNDVVTLEIGITAWGPGPADTSTTGQSSQTAPVAGDPFSPLTVPAPADGGSGGEVAPTPEPNAPAEQDTSPVPGTPETTTSTAAPADSDLEPAVVPESDTTVSPTEVSAPAPGADGTNAGLGVTPSSPAPTSDG